MSASSHSNEAASAPPHAKWVVLFGTLLIMAVTARMGWWQLDRAAQKKALQHAIESQATAEVLPAPALPVDAAEAERLRYRRITLRGEWQPEHTVYLENRQMRGRPGFFVLTPLKLPAGDAVLVQRGWLPRDMTDRTRIPPYRTPAGEVEVLGRIVAWPSRLTALGDEPAKSRLRRRGGPGATRRSAAGHRRAGPTGQRRRRPAAGLADARRRRAQALRLRGAVVRLLRALCRTVCLVPTHPTAAARARRARRLTRWP
jgi:surfeit locus 1 family protein